MKMDYKVSALKYRPNQFNKVVGQNHVTQTLINSIKENKIPSAILFCGPKGVGKTTCARIYAKDINKEHIKSENYDYAFNIFELDAASNRKIDDIRDLLDKVKVPPQLGKYKVYIIDEVHMLTKEAENAFLKTLEEPPSHIVFILATTEKNKILPTILSRCQIYDFRKISFEDNRNYLEKIIKSQGLKYDHQAISIIAKKAFGSLRDSLTILDRVINFTKGDITKNKVSEILNVLDSETYLKFTDLVLKSELNNAIIKFNDISEKGFDEKDFLEGLAKHFRDLIIVKSSESIKLISDHNFFNEIKIQSELSSQNELIRMIEIIEKSIINLSEFENKKLVVEISLMKICKKNKPLESLDNKKKNKIIESKATIKSQIKEISPKKKLEQDIEKKTSADKDNKLNSHEIKNISALSLSSLKIKREAKKEKDFINAERKKLSEKFSLKELKNKINLYTKRINNLGKKSLSSVLEINEPQIKKNIIIFSLPSKAILREFDIEKEDFLSFLQTALNNYEINIKGKLDDKKSDEYYSSPNEKLNKLIEINPLVLKLKDDLNLSL